MSSCSFPFSHSSSSLHMTPPSLLLTLYISQPLYRLLHAFFFLLSSDALTSYSPLFPALSSLETQPQVW